SDSQQRSLWRASAILVGEGGRFGFADIRGIWTVSPPAVLPVVARLFVFTLTPMLQAAYATLSGSSDLSCSVRQINNWRGTAVLAGSGALVADSYTITPLRATATLSGSGGLFAQATDPFVEQFTSSLLAGASTFVARAYQKQQGQATLAGAGTAVVSGRTPN